MPAKKSGPMSRSEAGRLGAEARWGKTKTSRSSARSSSYKTSGHSRSKTSR